MQSASLAVKNLATYGEATEDCLDLFELLECSICHPKVGIQSRICASSLKLAQMLTLVVMAVIRYCKTGVCEILR